MSTKRTNHKYMVHLEISLAVGLLCWAVWLFCMPKYFMAPALWAAGFCGFYGILTVAFNRRDWHWLLPHMALMCSPLILRLTMPWLL